MNVIGRAAKEVFVEKGFFEYPNDRPNGLGWIYIKNPTEDIHVIMESECPPEIMIDRHINNRDIDPVNFVLCDSSTELLNVWDISSISQAYITCDSDMKFKIVCRNYLEKRAKEFSNTKVSFVPMTVPSESDESKVDFILMGIDDMGKAHPVLNLKEFFDERLDTPDYVATLRNIIKKYDAEEYRFIDFNSPVCGYLCDDFTDIGFKHKEITSLKVCNDLFMPEFIKLANYNGARVYTVAGFDLVDCDQCATGKLHLKKEESGWFYRCDECSVNIDIRTGILPMLQLTRRVNLTRVDQAGFDDIFTYGLVHPMYKGYEMIRKQ
jgi:hypothetical protein